MVQILSLLQAHPHVWIRFDIVAVRFSGIRPILVKDSVAIKVLGYAKFKFDKQNIQIRK